MSRKRRTEEERMRAWRWLMAALLVMTMVGVPPAQAASAVHVTRVTAAATPSTVYVGTRTVLAGAATPKTAAPSSRSSGSGRATGEPSPTCVRARAARTPSPSSRPRSRPTWVLRVVGTGAAEQVHPRAHHQDTVHGPQLDAGVRPGDGHGRCPVVVTGSVSPEDGRVMLPCRHSPAGAWHTVASALLAKTWTYALGVNKPAGVYRLRVVRAFTKTVAAGTSKTLVVTVVAPPTTRRLSGRLPRSLRRPCRSAWPARRPHPVPTPAR